MFSVSCKGPVPGPVEGISGNVYGLNLGVHLRFSVKSALIASNSHYGVTKGIPKAANI